MKLYEAIRTLPVGAVLESATEEDKRVVIAYRAIDPNDASAIWVVGAMFLNDEPGAFWDDWVVVGE